MTILNDYKAKNESGKKWVFGSLIKTKKSGNYILEEKMIMPIKTMDASNFVLIKDETIGQFIDVVDSMKNKVYTGDIILLNVTPNNCKGLDHVKEIAEVGIVEWSSEKGYFVIKSDNKKFGCHHQINKKNESNLIVLGNKNQSDDSFDSILSSLIDKSNHNGNKWVSELLKSSE